MHPFARLLDESSYQPIVTLENIAQQRSLVACVACLAIFALCFYLSFRSP